MANKQTQAGAASKASGVLRDKKSSSKEKSAAGSAMSQKNTPRKTTGAQASSKASSVMKDKNASSKEKSAAASSLSQKGK